MSWHTTLQIRTLGYSDPVELQFIEEIVLKQLREDKVHPDVYLDLKQAFERGETVFNVHAAYLKQLLRRVSSNLPRTHFEVRCLGEEFRHTWVATFQHGKEVFSHGPWDYDA
jgi:hypothetical protein